VCRQDWRFTTRSKFITSNVNGIVDVVSVFIGILMGKLAFIRSETFIVIELEPYFLTGREAFSNTGRAIIPMRRAAVPSPEIK
jgi:hypothetical protein